MFVVFLNFFKKICECFCFRYIYIYIFCFCFCFLVFFGFCGKTVYMLGGGGLLLSNEVVID